MVKHMIIWKLKDSVADKDGAKADIKAALEGLLGKIDGLLAMRILTEGLPSSSGDLMMDSAFTDKAALDAYVIGQDEAKDVGKEHRRGCGGIGKAIGGGGAHHVGIDFFADIAV